jgi:hypothetical protein
MVARYRCGMGEYASDRGRDDRNEWVAARWGVSRELAKSSVAEVRVCPVCSWEWAPVAEETKMCLLSWGGQTGLSQSPP